MVKHKFIKNNIISDESDDFNDDDVRDTDFRVTKKLLNDNSDTECEEYKDNKKLMNRYGGKVCCILDYLFLIRFACHITLSNTNRSYNTKNYNNISIYITM
jgi:hypothetical protein